jgi:catechol 2,3-dioxygenase-like lactoylglutathione lyase family enzyme
MQFGAAVPILRTFDADKARAFYVDYLGFTVDFEHRFDDLAPLYVGVSRGACRLHLSEHHGDATPGAKIRIPISDIDAFHSDLTAKSYPEVRPNIETMPWDSREMTLTDPFSNRLVFFAAPLLDVPK